MLVNFAYKLNSLTIFEQRKRHIEDNFSVFLIHYDFFYKVSCELFASGRFYELHSR